MTGGAFYEHKIRLNEKICLQRWMGVEVEEEEEKNRKIRLVLGSLLNYYFISILQALLILVQHFKNKHFCFATDFVAQTRRGERKVSGIFTRFLRKTMKV
jgi:hypothetical protein